MEAEGRVSDGKGNLFRKINLKRQENEYQNDKDGTTAAVRRSDRAGIADAASLRDGNERNEDVREKICGNWESVEGKPDILVYKEGAHYKVTLFRRTGVRRKLKPENLPAAKGGGR